MACALYVSIFLTAAFFCVGKYSIKMHDISTEYFSCVSNYVSMYLADFICTSQCGFQ